MSRKDGTIFIVEPEPAAPCAYCGEIKELRPYGKKGARICYKCGMKPENIRETEKQYDAATEGTDTIKVKDTRTITVITLPDMEGLGK